MKKRVLLVLLGALLAASIVCGQQQGFSVKTLVDWKGGTLQVTVTRALSSSMPALPRAEADAEAAIDAAFTELFMDAVSPLVVDSSRTVSQLLSGNPEYFDWMHDCARGVVKDELFLSPDLTSATAHYVFSLFGDHGIATPLYPKRSIAPPERLGYVPSRAFSGLVIYAKDMLPSIGESQERFAVPALFPRLFDEEMNLVFDKDMCLPSALAKWGMVGYTDEIDEDTIVRRTGRHPLRIVARAVFGINKTDLVIASQTVRQLLTVSENIDIFREGRILVIYQSLK
jgi:hypothetical protein